MTLLPLLLLMSGATADEARVATDKFAECVVNKHGYRVRPLLDEPVGDKAVAERWLKVINSSCLNEKTVGGKYEDEGQMRFSPMVIRGALFEVLLKRDYGSLPRTESFDAIKSVKYAAQAKLPSSAEASYSVAMNIGECTVREATGSSYGLLATLIGTKDEADATQLLLPAIESCTPTGVTLEFSMSVIRGMVAEPMYRLTKVKAEAEEN